MINDNAVDYEEIIRLYKQADDKGEQIRILAELTASDDETIIEVLKDHGVYNEADLKLRTCTMCGKQYTARTNRGKAICRNCHYLHESQIHQVKKRRKETE